MRERERGERERGEKERPIMLIDTYQRKGNAAASALPRTGPGCRGISASVRSVGRREWWFNVCVQ